MPLCWLDLNLRAYGVSRRKLPSIPIRLSVLNLSRGFFPGRGLLVSFPAHLLIVLGSLYLTFTFTSSARIVPSEDDPTSESHPPDLQHVVYLPRLGGGSEGSGRRGGGAGRRGGAASAALGSKGFSYPGPQEILSDPPSPTNRIQTILQPALKNPLILKPLIPAPNIVRITEAGPNPLLAPKLPSPARPQIPQPKPLTPASAPRTPRASEPALPAIPAAVSPSEETPKLVVPVSKPLMPVEELRAPQPAARNIAEPVAPQPTTHFSPVATHGPDLQNLVILSPMPASPDVPTKIPSGEARGRFAISPEPNSGSTEDGPGSKNGSTAPGYMGLGSANGSPNGNGAASGAAGTGSSGTGSGSGGNGNGNGRGGGVGTGTGGGTGSGNGGMGTGSGPGSGTGPGTGHGPGNNPGSGSGPASGAGNSGGAFPGITIRGGTLSSGVSRKGPARDSTPLAPQTSYGMTILSTASSGGGLGDFGVFSNEKVYTVYLDMRLTQDDPTPAWTLECAAIRPPSSSAETAKDGSSSSAGFVLPFPSVKESPQFPAELLQKYGHGMIVLSAIIDTRGKIANMWVKQSPNYQLNKPLFEALSKWEFRPAELDGEAVAVKILLGVPLPPHD